MSLGRDRRPAGERRAQGPIRQAQASHRDHESHGRQLATADDCRLGHPVGDHGQAMSTRYLIIAALVTGLVILAASAVQFLLAR